MCDATESHTRERIYQGFADFKDDLGQKRPKMDSRSPPVSPAASNLLKRMYRMRGTAGSVTSRRTGAVGVLFVDNDIQGPRTRSNGHNDETFPFPHQTRHHKTTRLVNQDTHNIDSDMIWTIWTSVCKMTLYDLF